MNREELKRRGEEVRADLYAIANRVAQGEPLSDADRALAAVVIRQWALNWKGRVRRGQDAMFDHDLAVSLYVRKVENGTSSGEAVADLAAEFKVSEVSIRKAIRNLMPANRLSPDSGA